MWPVKNVCVPKNGLQGLLRERRCGERGFCERGAFLIFQERVVAVAVALASMIAYLLRKYHEICEEILDIQDKQHD
jgi:hypothetical protein